jgi:DNA ligase (NAD+)
MSEETEIIRNLERTITEASQAYYEGKPFITDDKFDRLVAELREYDPDNEILKKTGTGYSSEKDSTGAKARHKYAHVGSLEKINMDTCEKYFSKKKMERHIITSKIDGGSVVVYYDDKGHFEKAITRGDGEVGIDCSSKLREIVPLKVNVKNIAVRGEITISTALFEKHYKDASSPRNTALGILNSKEPSKEEVKRLTFVAYNAYTGNVENSNETKGNVLEWLYEQGFYPVGWHSLFESEVVLDSPFLSDFLESLRGKLNKEFLADGLVITNDSNRFDEIAYKFAAETAQTTCTNIYWELSRNGRMIPVVYFTPVVLSGARLSKCSGFHAKWILENNVGVGSKLVVHRAGEVIPYIKEVLSPSHSPTQSAALPSTCPSCSLDLSFEGVHLVCSNEKCPGKAFPKLMLWYETLGQVDGLGENILSSFFEFAGWETVKDIYSENMDFQILSRKTFQHRGFTDHATSLLLSMLSKVYKEPVDPEKFFAAFGLPSVGRATSEKISRTIGIDEFFASKSAPPLGKIASIEGVTFPARHALTTHYQELYSAYTYIKERNGFVQAPCNGSLMEVVITGKLSKSRKEFESELAKFGISVADSVNKNTACLITDNPNSGSSKNKAAQKMGIAVLSEAMFRKEYNL